MTTTANYHPDTVMLSKFLDGSLPLGINAAVSGHVDRCAECRRSIPALAERSSQDWYDSPDQDVDLDFSQMLDQIVDNPKKPLAEAGPESARVVSVRIRDRQVELPRLMAQIIDGGLAWEEIATGIHRALVDLDPATKFEFIYMEPGARVPRHTHLGQEVMLVLDGDISDKLGNYAVSDFVLRDQKDYHGQITSNGCICLFVTDAPLLFTEGLARLINPINRLKHWWAGRVRS